MFRNTKSKCKNEHSRKEYENNHFYRALDKVAFNSIKDGALATIDCAYTRCTRLFKFWKIKYALKEKAEFEVGKDDENII